MRMYPPFPHPLILGHRGAPLDAPENTLRSFAMAMEQGADGVELDVQAARDGVPVVIHDDALDRTTPARGRVAEHAWAALARLSGAELPSLAQAVAWAAAAGAWLNVEIKAKGVEAATLAELRQAGILERTLVSSFHPGVIAEVGRIAPDVRRFLLTDAWDDRARGELLESGAEGVCLQADCAIDSVLAELRERALPVVVWTVDEPARIRELLLHGVDAVITNRPRVAARVRDEVLARD